jgi:hypothetical protein
LAEFSTKLAAFYARLKDQLGSTKNPAGEQARETRLKKKIKWEKHR